MKFIHPLAIRERPCAIPARSRRIFSNLDPDAVDLARDANGVLARVLERGCLEDVTWLISQHLACSPPRDPRSTKDGVGVPSASAHIDKPWSTSQIKSE